MAGGVHNQTKLRVACENPDNTRRTDTTPKFPTWSFVLGKSTKRELEDCDYESAVPRSSFT